MNNKNKKDISLENILASLGCAFFICLIAFFVYGMGLCSWSGCNNRCASGEMYCYKHDSFRDGAELYERNHRNSTNYYKKSTNSSNSNSGSYNYYNNSPSTKRNFDSYSEGYDNIYMDDDFDMDRYYSDSDYASGVDDAMEDLDWDY